VHPSSHQIPRITPAPPPIDSEVTNLVPTNLENEILTFSCIVLNDSFNPYLFQALLGVANVAGNGVYEFEVTRRTCPLCPW
jgi:hypothetical protein